MYDLDSVKKKIKKWDWVAKIAIIIVVARSLAFWLIPGFFDDWYWASLIIRYGCFGAFVLSWIKLNKLAVCPYCGEYIGKKEILKMETFDCPECHNKKKTTITPYGKAK